MPINSKRKGNQAELEWSNWFNDVFKDHFKARYGALKNKVSSRSPRSGAFATTAGAGKYSGDVLSTITVFEKQMKFESKFYKKMAIYSIWNKHKRETGPHSIPIIGLKANYEKDDLIVMEKNDWAQLMKAAKKLGCKYHEA